MAQCRVDLAAMEWASPAEGVRSKVFSDDRRQLRLVEFSKGFIEPDWCLKGHIGYVLEGRGKLELASGSVTLGPGDGIFIPAGEEHKHRLTVLYDVVRVVLVEEAAR
jgi:quercetin dioxygenase-like cupin family protein